VPRNPKVIALMRADLAQANYKAAVRSTEKANLSRKRAMVACLDAGCTLYETGQRFGTTGSYVANVRAEMNRLAESRRLAKGMAG
jgi:hypothetical protein